MSERDSWEGYVPEPNSTCSNALRIQHKAYPRTCKKCGLGPCVELAQQALDKKAENARELGLDYGPVPENFMDALKFDVAKRDAEQPAQQEPVAWICEGASSDEKHAIDYWPEDVDALPIGTQLYTSPPAQRTWVGLTDEEVDEWTPEIHTVIRAIEAKLKEKNT